ncbi:receptor-like protein 7 [Lotus japonicus]|uniref:receptor-like protein 7 n=1 Tax=Lotus japonicus TaxID=34305 RepID=UPI0025886538|nr:receptor-like protein 7 [Lotus japonicus]
MKINPVQLLLVIPLYWFCLHNHIVGVSGLCLNDQKSLLLLLKNNFTSESSSKLNLWDPSDDCCAWMGVTCDKEGHVTGLDLSGEFIRGRLDNSSSLFNLQHLMNLNLATNYFNSTIPSGFNKLKNLTYLDLSYNSFAGEIPTEISQLTRLVALDLSSYHDSSVSVNLETQNLQKLVQNLTSLRKLYLDGVKLKARAQEWCNALLPLRDLQELSMVNCNLRGPIEASLSELENLSVITLDESNFSSPVPETFANFKNLTTLSLRDSNLNGRFPPKVFQIATLTTIDISSNANLHGFFPDFPLRGSLQNIRVSYTNFSGTLPHSIGNMRHLTTLDLTDCQFNGTLPNSLSNLTELTHLDLSYNNFTGLLPSFGMAKNLSVLDLSYNGLSGAISSSHVEALHSLVRIDLSHNSITGSIPSSLFKLPFLEEIYLNDNQFSQIGEFTNVSSSVLSDLDFSNNNIIGNFPDFIFHLSALAVLRLSSNKFHGPLQLNKLRNLIELDISYNNLSVNANMTSPFPNLSNLYMASCNLKTFPDFLRNQSTLFSLDLSKNQIQGIVPNWLWELNLNDLNISSNMLTDLEGPIEKLNNVSSLSYLDLHNNQLQGPIPIFPVNVVYLDYSRNRFSSVIPQDIGDYMSSAFFLSLSDNKFHGKIPDSLCSATNLVVLDLSINNMYGTIPSCLMTITDTLEVINLRDNNLTGTIPDVFPVSCAVSTLNLHGNHLHGPIPKTLARCSKLEVLDLGKNQISGGFPCFLENISTLRVLVLRNNKFQGSLGCGQDNKPWKMVQIVDIAFNNFSGKLNGKYFTNWETMMHDEGRPVSDFIHTKLTPAVYYQDSVTVINKGQQMEYVKILTVFTSIDFSSNHFEGPIPEELMDFKALLALNLSNNALSGEIPSSIGNLKQLESLDLSQNSLHGEIPVELASLTFLSYLNLSFNHLVGKIPTGTQLQSFQASSFEGNDGLHGLPLAEKQDGKKQGLLQQPACKRLACTVDWNFLSAELGFSSGIGIVIVPLLFWKKWRILYWKLMDQILCWIFPRLYIDYVTQRGHTHTVLRWWWR